MPEGDTIQFAAKRLSAVLAERTIIQAASPRGDLAPAALIGNRILTLEARGKHLILRAEHGLGVHSHLGMTGSWRIAGARGFSKPEARASLIIETAAGRVACFFPKLLRLATESELKRDPWLAALGPDLLGDVWDQATVAECVRRLTERCAAPLGVAIMDQRCVAGIGNVYKSELLFVSGLNPLDPVSNFTPVELSELLRKARRRLARNVGGGPRRTRWGWDGRRHWVYRRGGECCMRCGDKVRMQRQGDLGRSTYWCPTCQPQRSAC